MSRRTESIPYMLVNECPWWVSVMLSGVVYVGMKSIAPGMLQDNPIAGPIMQALPQAAGIAAMSFLALAGLSLWRQFLAGVSKHRQNLVPRLPEHITQVVAPPSCPACGGNMVERTAKKGSRPGSRFWGCSNYPHCHGTRSL